MSEKHWAESNYPNDMQIWVKSEKHWAETKYPTNMQIYEWKVKSIELKPVHLLLPCTCWPGGRGEAWNRSCWSKWFEWEGDNRKTSLIKNSRARNILGSKAAEKWLRMSAKILRILLLISFHLHNLARFWNKMFENLPFLMKIKKKDILCFFYNCSPLDLPQSSIWVGRVRADWDPHVPGFSLQNLDHIVKGSHWWIDASNNILISEYRLQFHKTSQPVQPWNTRRGKFKSFYFKSIFGLIPSQKYCEAANILYFSICLSPKGAPEIFWIGLWRDPPTVILRNSIFFLNSSLVILFYHICVWMCLLPLSDVASQPTVLPQ